MALEQAFAGPYVDQGITFRNPPQQTITPVPALKEDNHVGTLVYDEAGTQKTGFVHTAAPKGEPLPWAPRRDPYAVNGMVGQGFFNNPPS